jgi:cytosine/adenosine deaminase-related metal-dependent hydrolase
VHCVQIDATDIRTLQETGAGVCLCPGSNLYLGVGLPPVGDVLNAGIRPCLGTDSLASNPVLSIWREMNLLHDHFPAISAEEILAMATINGAHALHQPKYGQLQKGGVSMIFVDYDGNTPLNFLSFDLTPKNVSRCM